MFCPNCGKNLPDNSLFCGECGFRIEAPTAPTSPSKVKTQNSLSPTAPPVAPKAPDVPMYEAPTYYSEPHHAPDYPTEKSKPKSKVVIYILLALVAVLLITAAIVIAMVLNNKDSSSDSTEASTASVTEATEAIDIDYSYKSQYFPPVDTSNPNPNSEISTYTAIKSDYTWEDANYYAISEGANLVCINNATEFNEVCAIAENAGIKVFWVGASRFQDENWDYVDWSNGDAMAFTRWYDDEPSYFSTEGYPEEYLMVFKVGSSWYFNDAENDVAEYYSGRMGFIMEETTSTNGYYRSLTGSDKITLNSFISNFSEAFFSLPHEGDNTYYEMLNFAANNMRIHTPYNVTYSDGKIGIPADVVDQLLTKYFGTTVPHHEIESSRTSYKWTYSDNMYWHADTTGRSHAYFSIISDAYDNPDGTITVEFDVYYDPENAYDYPQSYWYSTFPEDAPREYSYYYGGEARLSKKVYNGTSTYELIQYSTY